MIRQFNTEQFCPRCFKEKGELKTVYVDPNNNTDLKCPIHGYVYETNRSRSNYRAISLENANPGNPTILDIIGEGTIGKMKIN